MAIDDEPLPEVRSVPWHKVDDLNAAQVAAMQSLDDARRAGEITEDDAAVIEQVIRDGHPHGARKRLTAARRRANKTGRGQPPRPGSTPR